MRADTLVPTQSRIGKFLRKGPVDMIVSLRWNLRNYRRELRNYLRFGIRSWHPRGPVPIYTAYYPDSVQSIPDLVPLYDRWVRGNKVNNNGDAARFMGLVLNLRQLEADKVPGDFAELGVWKGNSAAILAHFAARSGRRLFLFDTFSGFDQRDLKDIDAVHSTRFNDTSIGYVRETVGHEEITTCIQGFFPESIIEEVRTRTFALVHIDCDLYGPMKAALEFFYPRTSRGGMLVLHDYSSGSWTGATSAINEFCAATGEFLTLWPDKSGTAMIRKS